MRDKQKGRVELWLDDYRLPSYTVEYYNSQGQLAEVYNAKVIPYPESKNGDLYLLVWSWFRKGEVMLGVSEKTLYPYENYKKLYGEAKAIGTSTANFREVEFIDFTKKEFRPERGRNKLKRKG